MKDVETDAKIELSNLTEKIFKSYKDPGLHVCDLATGGGKSYTIAKLVCEYYPDYFDRIVILCCQNKLVDAMDREIDRFIDGENSRLKPEDKLVVRNNTEVAREAVGSGCLDKLLEEIKSKVIQTGYHHPPRPDLAESAKNIDELVSKLKLHVKTYEDVLKRGEKTLQPRTKDDVDKADSSLRSELKNFFYRYKKYLKDAEKKSAVQVASLLSDFKHLEKVYPQVRYKEKRVLLMTVHKAYSGIDPILSETVTLPDLADRERKVLFFFDESDQLAVALRNKIIEDEVEKGSPLRLNIYKTFLSYEALLRDYGSVTSEYHKSLSDNLRKGHEVFQKKWMGGGYKTELKNGEYRIIEPFKNILPMDAGEIEACRKGVFFCGPCFRLDFGRGRNGDDRYSFICADPDGRSNQFVLAHRRNKAALGGFGVVKSLDEFTGLITDCTFKAMNRLRNVVKESLDESRRRFSIEIGNRDKDKYYGYPTLEREIHTLYSRFDMENQPAFENQMKDFISVRRNQEFRTGGEECEKAPDYSVYFQGIKLYEERLDDRDNLHKVSISCREISTTPEKMLYEILLNSNASVVLCSATASSRTVVSNFDIQYLENLLGGRMTYLSEEDRNRFDELVGGTYPQDSTIEVVPIEHYSHSSTVNENFVDLPDKYKALFNSDALAEGLVDYWFNWARRDSFRSNRYEKGDGTFKLRRLYQFIEAYHFFYTHDDIHSMLFFQNFFPQKEEPRMYHVISCLIDGSYKENLNEIYKGRPDAVFADEDHLPDWRNKNLCFSRDADDVNNNVLASLSGNRDSKVMLITAYASFKAGANLQYEIPDGLDCRRGNSWSSEKKDWDAVYLQLPTNYVALSYDSSEFKREEGLLDVLLKLMMFYERGWFSRYKVKYWLDRAVSGNFGFRDDAVSEDRAAWVQNTVEQAVGRICRTKNKPPVTYILYDRDIEPFILKDNLRKSLTKEFRVFAEHVELEQSKSPSAANTYGAEDKRINDALRAGELLEYVRKSALHYLSPIREDDMDDSDNENGDDTAGRTIPVSVVQHQKMNQSFRHTIISKPVIDSFDELDGEDRFCTFITKCYGDWTRDGSGKYSCSYERDRFGKMKLIPFDENKASLSIGSEITRLDVFMKNCVIRRHFEENGFATEWKQGRLILHPDILMYDYTGEIGEEAFKALMLEYTSCTEESLTHLEGRDYELADFVVLNTDGTFKVAFDVKNFNPKAEHRDKFGDIPTNEKRREKLRRLGCPLYTVTMIEYPDSIDSSEITGLITDDGCIIQSALQKLQRIIDSPLTV